jgi:hypothetical protein
MRYRVTISHNDYDICHNFIFYYDLHCFEISYHIQFFVIYSDMFMIIMAIGGCSIAYGARAIYGPSGRYPGRYHRYDFHIYT